MNVQDWGPFPKLEALLEGAISGSMVTPLRWHQVLSATGAPWDLIARESDLVASPASLWPPVLPAVSSLPSPIQPDPSAALSRFAIWLIGHLRKEQVPKWVAKSINRAELLNVLARCHAWLGTRNLSYASRFYSPFWANLPIGLTRVTPDSILWTLCAFTLTKYGPEAFLQGDLLLLTKGALGDDQTAGDALALHVNIEALVELLAKNPPLAKGIASPPIRRPGGLRSAMFLRNYRALSQSTRPKELRSWLRVIDLFISRSPLTQLVYADLIPGSPSSVTAASTVTFSGEATWAHDFWHSCIARSLLGALLSEPPVFEELRAAEIKLENLRIAEVRQKVSAASKTRGNTTEQSGYDSSLALQIRAAADRCTVLRQIRATQYVQRLRSIAGLFRNADHHSGSAYLRVKLLDMLLRHVTTRSIENMIREWAMAQQQGGLPRARNVLFHEESGCFASFQEVLFGQPLATSLGFLSNEEAAQLRKDLVTLLDPPGSPEIPETVGQFGVPIEWVKRSIARFKDRTIGGVELPFPFPNNRGDSPAELAALWLAMLSAKLPSQRVETAAV